MDQKIYEMTIDNKNVEWIGEDYYLPDAGKDAHMVVPIYEITPKSNKHTTIREADFLLNDNLQSKYQSDKTKGIKELSFTLNGGSNVVIAFNKTDPSYSVRPNASDLSLDVFSGSIIYTLMPIDAYLDISQLQYEAFPQFKLDIARIEVQYVFRETDRVKQSTGKYAAQSYTLETTVTYYEITQNESGENEYTPIEYLTNRNYDSTQTEWEETVTSYTDKVGPTKISGQISLAFASPYCYSVLNEFGTMYEMRDSSILPICYDYDYYDWGIDFDPKGTDIHFIHNFKYKKAGDTDLTEVNETRKLLSNCWPDLSSRRHRLYDNSQWNPSYLQMLNRYGFEVLASKNEQGYKDYPLQNWDEDTHIPNAATLFTKPASSESGYPFIEGNIKCLIPYDLDDLAQSPQYKIQYDLRCFDKYFNQESYPTISTTVTEV